MIRQDYFFTNIDIIWDAQAEKKQFSYCIMPHWDNFSPFEALPQGFQNI